MKNLKALHARNVDVETISTKAAMPEVRAVNNLMMATNERVVSPIRNKTNVPGKLAPNRLSAFSSNSNSATKPCFPTKVQDVDATIQLRQQNHSFTNEVKVDAKLNTTATCHGNHKASTAHMPQRLKEKQKDGFVVKTKNTRIDALSLSTVPCVERSVTTPIRLFRTSSQSNTTDNHNAEKKVHEISYSQSSIIADREVIRSTKSSTAPKQVEDRTSIGGIGGYTTRASPTIFYQHTRSRSGSEVIPTDDPKTTARQSAKVSELTTDTTNESIKSKNTSSKGSVSSAPIRYRLRSNRLQAAIDASGSQYVGNRSDGLSSCATSTMSNFKGKTTETEPIPSHVRISKYKVLVKPNNAVKLQGDSNDETEVTRQFDEKYLETASAISDINNDAEVYNDCKTEEIVSQRVMSENGHNCESAKKAIMESPSSLPDPPGTQKLFGNREAKRFHEKRDTKKLFEKRHSIRETIKKGTTAPKFQDPLSFRNVDSRQMLKWPGALELASKFSEKSTVAMKENINNNSLNVNQHLQRNSVNSSDQGLKDINDVNKQRIQNDEMSVPTSKSLLSHKWPSDKHDEDDLSVSLSRNPSASFGSGSVDRVGVAGEPPYMQNLQSMSNHDKHYPTLSDIMSGSEWSSSDAAGVVYKTLNSLKGLVTSGWTTESMHSSAIYSDTTTSVRNTKKKLNRVTLGKFENRNENDIPEAVDTSTESVSAGSLDQNGVSVFSGSSRSGLDSGSGPDLDMKKVVNEIRSKNANNSKGGLHTFQGTKIDHLSVSEEKKDDENLQCSSVTEQNIQGIDRSCSSSNGSLDSMGRPIPAPLAKTVPLSSDVRKPIAALPVVQPCYLGTTDRFRISPSSHQTSLTSSYMGFEVQPNSTSSANLYKTIVPTIGTTDVVTSTESNATPGTLTPIMRMRNTVTSTPLSEEGLVVSQIPATDVAEFDYLATKQKKWKQKMKIIERQREEEKRVLTADSLCEERSRASRSQVSTSRSMKKVSKKNKSKKLFSAKSRRLAGFTSFSDDASVAVRSTTGNGHFHIACHDTFSNLMERLYQPQCGAGFDETASIAGNYFGNYDDDDDDDDDDEDDDDEILSGKGLEHESSFNRSFETEKYSLDEESRATDDTRQFSTDLSEPYSRSTRTTSTETDGSTVQSSRKSKRDNYPSARKVGSATRDTNRKQTGVGTRDRNFIRSFIDEVTSTGFQLILHKKNKRQATVQSTRVVAFIKKGEQGQTREFSVPRLLWESMSDGSELGRAELFEVRSLEKAAAVQLENYSISIPGRSIVIQMNNGIEYVFEADDESSSLRFIHGMRWVIARLSFNLIIGNLSVSCEMLAVDRSPNNGSDNDDTSKFPKTVKEESQWSKAMNDVTNHLMDRSGNQISSRSNCRKDFNKLRMLV